MKMRLRSLLLFVARRLGTNIRDCATGDYLGRALVIPWRGKIKIIGLEAAVRPIFLSQPRLTYWKQEVGFTKHPAPDFPNERPPAAGHDKSQ